MTVAAVVAAGVIWEGAVRTPADPAVPLELRGEAGAGDASPERLRIGTFNIHGGRGPEGVANLDATAAVLRNAGADLIGLNEVRAGFDSDQASALGDRLGMANLFAPTERQWWHTHLGNGLLTRRPLSATLRIPLPGTKTKGFRNAVLVVTDLGGRPVRVLATHIDRGGDRDRQLAAAAALFLALEPPAVLLGDFNAEVTHPTLAALVARPEVMDALTQRLGPTAGRIDHIFLRGLDCPAAGLVENTASDHPHVWADIALAEQPPS